MQSIRHSGQQQADSQRRIDDLNRQIGALRLRLEETEDRLNELERSRQLQTAQIAGISQLLEKVAKRKIPKPVIIKTVRPAKSRKPAETGPTDKPQPADKPDLKTEKDRYTAAYLALKSGRYEDSVAAFEQLLADHPKGEFSDQAWFWLGESYLAQQAIGKAIRAFRHVVRDYPESAKHAAALLKLGQAYEQTRRKKDARSAYEKLVREHPDSEEYRLAVKRLRALSAVK